MNKKWIIMSVAVLAISACIAIFVFAQAGVRIPSDVARVDSILNGAPVTEDIRINNRPVAGSKVVAAIKGKRGFDDTDRLAVSGDNPVMEVPALSQQEAVKAGVEEKKSAPESPSTVVSVVVPVSGTPGVSYDNNIQTSSQYSSKIVPKDNIKTLTPEKEVEMPELPSLGGEYENDDDENGSTGVALPQLPDDK